MVRSRFVARTCRSISRAERVGKQRHLFSGNCLKPGTTGVVIDGPVINLNYNFYGPLKTVSYICSYPRPLSDETRTTRVDL